MSLKQRIEDHLALPEVKAALATVAQRGAAQEEQPGRWDRFTSSVQITANKPLTQKQWDAIHKVLTESFEDAIAESPKLTKQIGHVHLSGWGNGREICV